MFDENVISRHFIESKPNEELVIRNLRKLNNIKESNDNQIITLSDSFDPLIEFFTTKEDSFYKILFPPDPQNDGPLISILQYCSNSKRNFVSSELQKISVLKTYFNSFLKKCVGEDSSNVRLMEILSVYIKYFINGESMEDAKTFAETAICNLSKTILESLNDKCQSNNIDKLNQVLVEVLIQSSERRKFLINAVSKDLFQFFYQSFIRFKMENNESERNIEKIVKLWYNFMYPHEWNSIFEEENELNEFVEDIAIFYYPLIEAFLLHLATIAPEMTKKPKIPDFAILALRILLRLCKPTKITKNLKNLAEKEIQLSFPISKYLLSFKMFRSNESVKRAVCFILKSFVNDEPEIIELKDKLESTLGIELKDVFKNETEIKDLKLQNKSKFNSIEINHLTRNFLIFLIAVLFVILFWQ